MQDFVNQLVDKTGIDKATAEKVNVTLQENAAKLPALLNDNAQGLIAILTKLGVSQAIADKIIAFLKEHAADLPKLLAGEGAAGILEKAKSALGGILGSKDKA